MSSMLHQTLYLYGGQHPWDAAQWETSDDRVRGGSSRSHLIVADPHQARFCGHLDTKTLGGAGFASQHTAGELQLDLSAYEGLVLSVVKPPAAAPAPAVPAAIGLGDRKRYAVTLKDTLPNRRDDGRERAGISWEADFTWGFADGSTDIFLPWAEFKATYRGRNKPDAEPLNLENIKRIGLMMRSFFDQQDGDFQIDLQAIAARRMTDGLVGAKKEATTKSGDENATADPNPDDEDEEEDDLEAQKRSAAHGNQPGPIAESEPRSWWKGLLCGLL